MFARYCKRVCCEIGLCIAVSVTMSTYSVIQKAEVTTIGTNQGRLPSCLGMLLMGRHGSAAGTTVPSAGNNSAVEAAVVFNAVVLPFWTCECWSVALLAAFTVTRSTAASLTRSASEHGCVHTKACQLWSKNNRATSSAMVTLSLLACRAIADIF